MKRTHFMIIAFCLLTIGCINKNDFNFKNIKYTNWTPDWALPFISSTLTMQNMLKAGSIISTDSTSGLLSLHYSGRGFSFKASDFINIPDQHFTTPPVALTYTVTSLPVGATASDSFSNNFNYSDPNGSQLAHIGLKAGTFHINLQSTYNQNINLSIIFPNIKYNGNPIQLPVSITYPSTTSDAYIDLSNYLIDFTNGGITRNFLAYKLIYTLSGTGQPIDASSSMTATIEFTNLKYSFLDGSIGHFEIPIPSDSINIGVLNKSISANVKLLNPKLNLTLISSFGLSVYAKFDSLFGYSTNGAIDTIVVPPVKIIGDSILNSPPSVSYFTIDSTNSTLRNLFSPIPNYIVYNGHVSINPTPTLAYNFLYDTSTISVSIDADLPACFQIIQLALQDTVQMLMPADTGLLTKAQFAMQVVNAFPVYASVQVYFTDSNYVTLDSLVTPYNNLIAAAPVNSFGIVKDSSVQVTNFILERNRYMLMASRIRHGLIRGNLYTSGTGSIQLHATDHLRVKTAFRFTLDYNL